MVKTHKILNYRRIKSIEIIEITKRQYMCKTWFFKSLHFANVLVCVWRSPQALFLCLRNVTLSTFNKLFLLLSLYWTGLYIFGWTYNICTSGCIILMCQSSTFLKIDKCYNYNRNIDNAKLISYLSCQRCLL